MNAALPGSREPMWGTCRGKEDWEGDIFNQKWIEKKKKSIFVNQDMMGKEAVLGQGSACQVLAIVMRSLDLHQLIQGTTRTMSCKTASLLAQCMANPGYHESSELTLLTFVIHANSTLHLVSQ